MAQTYELRRRSIVKSISWRVFAAIITSCVVFVITGKGDFAAKVGLIDTAVKLLIYFLHERVWDKIDYGNMAAVDRAVVLGMLRLASDAAPPKWNEHYAPARRYVDAARRLHP